MTWFLIPLINGPQSFEITLGATDYILTVKWNDAADAGWELDLQAADTNEYLVAGQPLITGANCLAGLDYLGVSGMLIVSTDGNPDAVPTFENLGIGSNLYFVTEAA
jgi:hypothetical protein